MDFSELPQEVIDFFFNFNQGSHVDARCAKCKTLTDQVVVSYAQLPWFNHNDVDRVLGRVLDVVPAVRLFLGKPTLCRCGTLNRC